MARTGLENTELGATFEEGGSGHADVRLKICVIVVYVERELKGIACELGVVC